MQASPEPVSRALFPSSVTTMAIRGAIEVAVIDNLRLEDFCYAQAGTGSWARASAWNRLQDWGCPRDVPGQTPQEKSHCSQVVMVSCWENTLKQQVRARSGHRHPPTVLDKAMPTWVEERKADSLNVFFPESGSACKLWHSAEATRKYLFYRNIYSIVITFPPAKGSSPRQ